MLTKNSTLARASAQLLVSAALLVEACAATAGNLSFLNDTPITYMKQRDRQVLNNAAQKALETKRDGESLGWSNEGTGNPVAIKGSVTPLDTVKDGDRTCRTVTLVAIAKGQTQSWTPTVCKTGNSAWQILKK